VVMGAVILRDIVDVLNMVIYNCVKVEPRKTNIVVWLFLCTSLK